MMGVALAPESREHSPEYVGTKKWANRVRKEAKELVFDVENINMRLAKILYEIYAIPEDRDPFKKPIYVVWGFGTFYEYVEAELGIHRKKADRLKRIWYKIEVDLDLAPDLKDRILGLGVSKVRELVRVLKEDTAEEWIEQAETHNYTDLLRMILQYLDDLRDAEQRAADKGAEPEGADPEIREPEELLSETFRLYTEQARNVDEAIRRCKSISGSDKRGHNLDMICNDFLGSHDFGKDLNINRKRFFASLEKSMQIRIITLDKQTLQITYGRKNLEALAVQEEGED